MTDCVVPISCDTRDILMSQLNRLKQQSQGLQGVLACSYWLWLLSSCSWDVSRRKTVTVFEFGRLCQDLEELEKNVIDYAI